MSEVDDIDSFNDLNDDESEFFEDDPYEASPYAMGPSSMATTPTGNGLIGRVKAWWNTRSLSRSRLNRLNDRGIPLYDLDSDGRNAQLGADATHSFDPSPFLSASSSSRYKSHINTMMLYRTLKWMILLGVVVGLILHIVISAKSNGQDPYDDSDVSNLFLNLKDKNGFNGNKVYNNGTHDFYPLTLIMNLRSMSPSMISPERTPFLYSMVHRNASVNDTLVGVLEANFPFESSVQDWCMATGQFPLHQRNDSEVIWDTINATDGYRVDMYGWASGEHVDNMTSEEKISEMLRRIDSENANDELTREIMVLSIDDLYESVLHGGKTTTEDVVRHMDGMVRRVIYELRHRHLLSFTNMVILSDSGVRYGEAANVIQLDKILGKKMMRLIDKIDMHDGRVVSLRIEDIVDRNLVYKHLKSGVVDDDAVVKLYIRDTLPERYHYSMSKYAVDVESKDAIDHIWLIPCEGTAIVEGQGQGKGRGVMQDDSIFIMQGPIVEDLVDKRLKGNKCLRRFNNIAVYDIIRYVVGGVGSEGRDSYTLERCDDLSEFYQAAITNRTMSTRRSTNTDTTMSTDKSSTTIPPTPTPHPSRTSLNTVIRESNTNSQPNSNINSQPNKGNKIWNEYEDIVYSLLDKLKDTEEDIVSQVEALVTRLRV